MTSEEIQGILNLAETQPDTARRLLGNWALSDVYAASPTGQSG